jgi:hypothetical protein
MGTALLIVILLAAGLAPPWKSNKPTPKINVNTESVANNYLVSKVGYDNFKKLYAFDRARSGYGGSMSDYDFIAYHFAPFKTFASPEDIVMIQVNKHQPTEIYADEAPNCIKDKSLCNFNIDRQKALQVAKNSGITADDITVTTAKKKLL